MDLQFTEGEEEFRQTVRASVEALLVDRFAILRGRGGPGDEHAFIEERKEWERALGHAGWVGLGWPEEHGGRAATLSQQVIFGEEYARLGAPGRLGHIGENLLAPTVMAFGSEAQQKRFLPPILRGEEFWCQGYSEPNAGSDLANLQTRAVLDGTEWVVTGQKIWTSLAHVANWMFVLCRTDSAAPKHRGISYLLLPMQQPGITIRPIRQLTGTSEFCEVFFDDARTDVGNVVGEINGGWKVAMATLGFERGVSTLGQQLGFENELALVIERAKQSGAARDPLLRDRLAQAVIELRIMRWSALRTLAATERGELTRAAMTGKLFGSEWHQRLGKLAMDVLGDEAEVVRGDDLDPLQKLFLFTRADTLYAGTSEIQRNIIAERGLGLPKEPG